MKKMENNLRITAEQIADMIISDVLERWPETAVVFHKYNMACVGCVVAPFYTIEAAISIYSLNRDQFLQDLATVIVN